MPKIKLEELAEPFKNETKSADWQKYNGKKPVDYGQIEADKKKPTLLSDPAAWWGALTDDQKQEVLNTLGEAAGGTVGGIVGGGTPVSIPLAGGGAVAGKALARLAGKAAGLKTTPKTQEEEKSDVLQTAAWNAGGEALGAGMALAKPLVKRAAKAMINPDLNLVSLAEKAGVSLTPGMMTKTPGIRMVEAAIENTPGGMNTIRGKTVGAMKANEANLAQIPKRFNPTPVDRPEAGTAMRQQVDNNFDAVAEHFDKRYKDISRKVGNVDIDLQPAQDAARGIKGGIPEELWRFFPSDTQAKLNQLISAGAKEAKPTGLVDPSGTPILKSGKAKGKEYLLGADGKSLVDLHPDAAIRFDEARKLRTELLRAERNLNRQGSAFDREAIPKMRVALDDAIDKTIQPIDPSAHADWRAINGDYRKAMETLMPPSSTKARAGNVTAGKIGNHKVNVDNLVSEIGNSPSAIREADLATVPMLGAPNENAMGKFRRNRMDQLIADSKTKHPWSQGEPVVNANTMGKTLAHNDGMAEATAPVAQELKDNITLGRAIAAPSDLANHSKTSRFHEAMKYASAAGGLGVGLSMGDDDMVDRSEKAVAGAVIGGMALPKAAAYAWTHPKFAKALTTPNGPLAAPILAPALGAATRGIIGMSRLPEPELPAVPSLETPQPVKPKRITLDDLQ